MSRIHLFLSTISLIFSAAIQAQDATATTTTTTDATLPASTTTTIVQPAPTTTVVQPTPTTTVVEKRTIVTLPPKSVKCTTVSSHWEGTVWIDTQTVCNYENRAEGTAWVQDYWACTASTLDGTCTNWEYRPGHWIKTAL